MDINSGFNDTSQLLGHDDGQLSWQDVFDRSNTPPVPPDVVSKPQSALSSDEDEQQPSAGETRPLSDSGGNGGVSKLVHGNIFNSILDRATSELPGDVSESMMFGSTETGDLTTGNGSSFHGGVRGEYGPSTYLQENVTGLCVREGIHPPEVGDELVDEVPPTQPNAHTTTSATTTITTRIPTTNTISFFDEPHYEGSDFFSAGKEPLNGGDQSPNDSGTLIMTQPLKGSQSDKPAFSTEAVDSTVSGGVDFLANPEHSAASLGIIKSGGVATIDDIAAKWEALDDDFLPDDGEGFLSSDEETDPVIATAPQLSKALATSSTLSATIIPHLTAPTYRLQHLASPPVHPQRPYQPPYTPPIPAALWQSHHSPHPSSPIPQSAQYSQPHDSSFTPTSTLTSYYDSASTPIPISFQVTPLKLPLLPPSTALKAESFVDTEGTYKSPYDLPMDIVKPALSKRASIPHLSAAITSPPRQSPFRATPPPMVQSGMQSGIGSSQAAPTPPPQLLTTAPTVPRGTKPAFFEDLPIVTKPKPPTKYQPKALVGTLPQPVTTTAAHIWSPPPPQPPSARPTAATLVHTRYVPPPALQASDRPASVYTSPPAPGSVLPPQHDVPLATSHSSSLVPTFEPHQSPPCQRPVSTPPGPAADREHAVSQQSHHSPNLARYSPGDHHLHSSRPGTAKSCFAVGFETLREEDEVGSSTPSVISNRYSQRFTPPSSGPLPRGISRVAGPFSLSAIASPGVHSLQQQSSSRTTSPESFAPPRRAQTQSPSTLMHSPRGSAAQNQASQHAPRPASALAGNITPTIFPYFPFDEQPLSVSGGVKDFMNDAANFMPPQDSSVIDPLNRWQGCPIFSWGFGGNVVIMFPSRRQRNARGISQPVIKCSLGEVRIRRFRDVLTVEESLAKFPGPVYTGGKGTKTKKKEALLWITERIQTLEREATELVMLLPGEQTPSESERKRREEKVLLWKGMKVLLENDGIIEGFVCGCLPPSPYTVSLYLSFICCV